MKINLKERLQSLRLVASLAEFLRHPTDLDSVFRISGNLSDSPLGSQMISHLLANPAMAQLVEDNWRPAHPDLSSLEQLPEGSLGRIYAEQLRRLNITPDSLIDPGPVTSPQSYIKHRLRETHDIVHVLTGFGIDGAGELGIQAFNLAQNRSPLAVLLILGVLLTALQNNQPLEPFLNAMIKGFQLGMAADCVVSRKLEDGWERPIVEWRRELGLPDAP